MHGRLYNVRHNSTISVLTFGLTYAMITGKTEVDTAGSTEAEPPQQQGSRRSLTSLEPHPGRGPGRAR
jgi:hypothetical protein